METSLIENRRSLSMQSTVRRHIVLIVVLTVVVTALGVLYAAHKPTRYTSTASVLVRALPGNALTAASLASNQQIDVAMETEVGLVSSPEVAAAAARTLHESVEGLADHVSASVPSNTEIVVVKFTAGTSAAAQDGAAAFANAFLSYRKTQAVNSQQVQLRELRRQETLASTDLNTATANAASPHPPANAATLVQLAANRLGALQTSIGTLQVFDSNPGAVVTPPAPGKPSGLSTKIVAVAAFLVGLGLALCIAIWRERRDDRFRAVTEASVVGIPILASLPADDDDAALDNAYRRARTGLVAATRTPNTLVVSALLDVDDRGEVAANLALSLARAGYDVTLVDAGIDGTDLPEMLGSSGGPGLSNLLGTTADVRSMLEDVHGIGFLGVGTDPASARERLASPQVKDLLATLRRSNDYVIVSAPNADTPEAESLAWAGDGLVLVIGDQVTTHQELGRLVEETDRLGITVLGAVSLPVRRSAVGRRRSARPTAAPADARRRAPRANPDTGTAVESA